MIALVRDKCQTLHDFKDNLEFFFNDTIKFTDDDLRKLHTPLSIKILNYFVAEIDIIESHESFVLNNIINLIKTQLNCAPKEIWEVLRLSITGEKHGPSLESIILIYGFGKTKKRINELIQ